MGMVTPYSVMDLMQVNRARANRWHSGAIEWTGADTRTYHTSSEVHYDKDGRPESVELLHVNRHLLPMLRHTGTFVKVKPPPHRLTRHRKLKTVVIA